MSNKTLWSIWNEHAEKNPDGKAIIHWVAGEDPFVWTYRDLLQTAKKFSRLVFEKGVKKGDVCAIIIKHNPLFYPLYLGISGAGALPAILAYPNPRLHPDKFRQGLSGMSQRSGLDHIFTQREMESIIRPFFESDESTVKDMIFPFEFDLDSIDLSIEHTELNQIRSNISENEPVLLQHSSGTTGLQKPVVLSHKAIWQHVDYLAESLELKNSDKIASWLPLYHDMGLIACFHLPLVFGIPTVQLDPFEWVIAPDILLDAVSKEKATLTWLPNFAYSLMGEKIRLDDLENVSLSSLRANN
jgi:fatty-acyl-CoA synthase